MPFSIQAPSACSPLPAMPSPAVSRTVAVIGAGAAGLCAALELRREGHRVVVYEREDRIGGTWAYTPETETDPIGLDPTRKVVHTSLYASLRTNLPREVMGFRVYPFVPTNKPGRDSRRFPGHAEVLEYLKDFAQAFRLHDLVRFGREVCHVEQVEDRKWIVRSRKRDGGDVESNDDVYDAVVVCNGHYTEPRIAQLPGIDAWPGKQIHSHNYRVPDPFHDQIVVLIGGAASSDDISRDIAKVAKEVHISTRSDEVALGKLPGRDNICVHSMIESVHKDGTVAFHDQTKVCADVILHCTGYKFHFPFLNIDDDMLTVDDNRVGPLFKHIFPPTLAPWLSFVGLPWKVVPFPLFEFQSKWIAGILSGRIQLPSTKEMMSDIEAFYGMLDKSGIPKRYTHKMGSVQFEYNAWLAVQSGVPPTEEWRENMYYVTGRRKRSVPETYRDKWEDEDLVRQAYEGFKQYMKEGSQV